MDWNLKTDAASEPITTAQAKAHLRVDHSEDDDYIDILITTARQVAERLTSRIILTQTWELILDAFPASSSTPIRFPLSPLMSIESVKYIDTAGDQQTWSADEYQYSTDHEPGQLKPACGYTYPSTRNDYPTVIIEFKCGYDEAIGDADAALIPLEMIHLVYLLVGHFYETREATADVKLYELPLTIQSLVNLVKVGWDYWNEG